MMPRPYYDAAKRWAAYQQGGLQSSSGEETSMSAIAPILPVYRSQPDSKRKNHPPKRNPKRKGKPQKEKPGREGDEK